MDTDTTDLTLTPMSRKAAKQLGLIHFTPIQPKTCRHGHTGGLFTVSSFTCVACTKARNKVIPTLNPALESLIRGDSHPAIADDRIKEWVKATHAWSLFSESLYSSNPHASYYRYRAQCSYTCVAHFYPASGVLEVLGPFDTPIRALEVLEKMEAAELNPKP